LLLLLMLKTDVLLHIIVDTLICKKHFNLKKNKIMLNHFKK